MFARTRTFVPLGMLAAIMAGVLLLAACAPQQASRSVVIKRSGGAASAPAGGQHAYGQLVNDRYIVAKGDTLYSVAFRYKADFRQVAAWNNIDPPYIIHPGDKLLVAKPGSKPPVIEAGTAGAASAASQTASTAGQTSKAPTTTQKAATDTVAVAGEKPSAASSEKATTAVRTVGKTRKVDGITWSWPASGRVSKTFKPTDTTPGIRIAGNNGDPVYAAADGVVVYSGNGLVGYGDLIIIKHDANYLSAYGHNSKRLVEEGAKIKAGQQVARMGSTGSSSHELEFQVRRDGKPVNPLNYLPPQ